MHAVATFAGLSVAAINALAALLLAAASWRDTRKRKKNVKHRHRQ